MDTINSREDLEQTFRRHIKEKKISKILQRFMDFVSDQNRIPQSNVKQIIQALFNISDDIPEEKVGIFGFSVDNLIGTIIYQLLKREVDKNKIFKVLSETIPPSEGLFGPIQQVSLESPRKGKDENAQEFIVSKNEIEKLQRLCLKKISETCIDDLLNHKNLLYILYRWKEWDKEASWKEFVNKITRDDEKLLGFLAKFVLETKSHPLDDHGLKITISFNHKDLSNFLNSKQLEQLETRLREIVKQNPELYKANKEVIDLFFQQDNRKRITVTNQQPTQ